MIDSESHEKLRLHLLQHGWNSTCWQLLNSGIQLWWSHDELALVGYVVSGRLAITAGAPVCSEDRLGSAIDEWESFADVMGLEVCYFGAEERLQRAFEGREGKCMISMGSQPEWSPSQFLDSFDQSSSLRAQRARAVNKGVKVEEWNWEKAEKSLVLKRVLNEWLDTRGLPTLHFLVEPDTLSDLKGRRLFVALLLNEPIGFVTLCPIPARDGWLTEQFVRGRLAPNGTVELMLYHAVKAVSDSGSSFLTMGIIPLVDSGTPLPSREPFWLSCIKWWAKAHYIRFYNFRGLHEFKRKFRPTSWKPVVVILRSDKLRSFHLHGIAKAFTQIPPELALIRGLWKSIIWEAEKLALRGNKLK